MPIRILLCLLLLAAALSGCGRRGPLELPPEPDVSAATGQPVPATAEAEPLAPGSATLADPQSSTAGAFPDQQSAGSQEPPEAVSAGAPKKRFFLDPLL